MPTSWPCLASAKARFTVTDDFPTPPLPELMPSTRVFTSGSLNGLGRPSSCPSRWPPWAWPWPACPPPPPPAPWSRSRRAARSSSVITVSSTSTPVTPSRGDTAWVTRLVISVRSGQPATVRATTTSTWPPLTVMRLTMSRSTIDMWSSGSCTGRSASRTCASVTGIDCLRWSERERRGITTISIGTIPGVAQQTDGPVPNRPVIEPVLNDGDFSAAVVAVTSAFGDPTRRHIYLFARESELGVTAAEVAERFDLHPNVARHHLDKLAAGGYVDVTTERAASGAGRPSKRYRPSEKVVGLDRPARRDDLLVTLLGRALALVPPAEAEAMAEQLGEEYGRSLAAHMSPNEGQRSFRAALHAVADALTAHGFAAHAESRGDALAIIKEQCPFGGAANEHPVICAVDRGMVRGMLTALTGGPVRTMVESSRAQGDDACVTFV